jgi:hypothetical protein
MSTYPQIHASTSPDSCNVRGVLCAIHKRTCSQAEAGMQQQTETDSCIYIGVLQQNLSRVAATAAAAAALNRATPT